MRQRPRQRDRKTVSRDRKFLGRGIGEREGRLATDRKRERERESERNRERERERERAVVLTENLAKSSMETGTENLGSIKCSKLSREPWERRGGGIKRP